MVRKVAIAWSWTWRGLVALLSVEIAVVSILRYVAGGIEAPAPVVANAFANPFLVIHVIGGVTALLIGPLQFIPAIRARMPRLHRISGRIFAGACAVGAPAAFMVALGTTAGPVAAVGFAIPAILWPIFTWLGVQAAIRRQFDEHREWMLRSYALTSTAITLRLMLPAAGVIGIGFFPAYRVISWAAWMTNLVLLESYIRRNRRPRAATLGRLAAA